MTYQPPAMSGSLDKLQIEAFLDPQYSKKWVNSINPLSVAINPASYSQGLSALFAEDKAARDKAKAKIFNRPGDVTLRLELILDGTGAVPNASTDSVEKQIRDLRLLAVQVNPDTDSPHYLRLVWGSLLFKGRIQTLEISCTLFNPDGTPLRAKVSANFVGVNDDAERTVSEAGAARTGTSAVEVLDGDTLPKLCERLYGDSKYYLEVAKMNDLDSFNLEPGSTLTFPQLAQLKSKALEDKLAKSGLP